MCTATSLSAQTLSFNSTSACLGEQTMFQGAYKDALGNNYPDSSIAAWAWDMDNDSSYDDAFGKSAGYMFFQAGSHPVGLKVTLKSGASDSLAQPDTAFVNHLPQAGFITENLCEGQTAVFTSTSFITSGSIAGLYWDFRNDSTENDSGSVVSFNCGPAETYQTRLRCVSDKGCQSFTLKTTQVFHQPVPAFTVQSACLGGNTSFTNNTVIQNENIAFYVWDFGDGDSSALANPVHVFSSEQTYNIKLTAISENSCKATATSPVSISQLVNAGFTVQNACRGESAVFTNTTSTLQSETISTYQWNFGDAGTGMTSANASHVYPATGTYPVTLVAVSTNGCTDTTTANVEVFDLPSASLIISGDTINDSTFYKGEQVTLSITGASGSFQWSNGAMVSSITTGDSGVYNVTVTNSNGCSQILSKKLTMKEIPDTAAAGNDIITPNGDGINDVFTIMDVAGYKQCSINIYNIWNEEVYNSSGYKNDWNGKNKNGNDLDAGAYFYILKCDDKPQTVGTVNILR